MSPCPSELCATAHVPGRVASMSPYRATESARPVIPKPQHMACTGTADQSATCAASGQDKNRGTAGIGVRHGRSRENHPRAAALHLHASGHAGRIIPYPFLSLHWLGLATWDLGGLHWAGDEGVGEERAGRRPAPARTIEYGRKGGAKGCVAHNKWQGRTGNRPPLRPFSGKDLQASSAAHHARPRLQIKWERDLSFVLGACRLMSLTPSLATGK